VLRSPPQAEPQNLYLQIVLTVRVCVGSLGCVTCVGGCFKRVERRSVQIDAVASRCPNTVRRTIGDVRAWTIDGARAEANRLRVTLDSGLDPRVLDKQREEKVKLQIAKELARAVTVGDAWKVYIAERTKTWRPRTLADHVRMIEPGGRKANRGTRGRGITVPGPIYPLLQVRLVDLTPEVVERWAKTEGEERPTFGRLVILP